MKFFAKTLCFCVNSRWPPQNWSHMKKNVKSFGPGYEVIFMQNVVKFGWAVSPESAQTRTASGRGDRGENIVSPRNFVSGDTIIMIIGCRVTTMQFYHDLDLKESS